MNIIKKIKKDLKEKKVGQISYNEWDNPKEYKAIVSLQVSEIEKKDYTIKFMFISGVCCGMANEPGEVKVFALHKFK